MSYRVEFTGTARRDWRALAPDVQDRISPAIDGLADDPRPRRAKALKGQLRGKYRIRVGDWRVAYSVDDADGVVTVVEVAHRSTVYARAQRGQSGE